MENVKISFGALLVALTVGQLLTSLEAKAGNALPGNEISNSLITCESEVNPNSTIFVLNFHVNERSDVDIHLYDQCGNDLGSVYKGLLNEGEANIDIDCSRFVKGIYVCEIKTCDATKYVSLQKIF